MIVLVGYLGIRMPLTYWLTCPVDAGGLGLGLRGAWLAMFVDLAARGILVAARFLGGGWKTGPGLSGISEFQNWRFQI